MPRLLKLTVTAALVAATISTSAHAANQKRWLRYQTQDSKSAPVLIVKTICLGAEDSLAHLRPIAIKPGDKRDRVVLGCQKRGY